MKKLIVILLTITAFAGVSFAGSQVFFANGAANVKKVALTFDDGPGEITSEILAILKEKGVKATFFMLGCNAVTYPNLAKAVADGGHEIGNHTYGHINFYSFTGVKTVSYYMPSINKDKSFEVRSSSFSYKTANRADILKDEILKSQDAILAATGVKTVIMRYPYGYAKPDAIEMAQSLGYKVINWSFGCDWTKLTAEEMHAKYKAAIQPGAIFLMHDGSKSKKVPSFLGELIDEIRAQGYDIVTVGELLDF